MRYFARGGLLILAVCRRVEEPGTVETAHRVLEHCSNVFRFAIRERLVPSDSCRDLRGALKKPISKRFAAIAKPRELAGLLKATYAYQGTMVVQCALQLAHEVKDLNGDACSRAEYILKREEIMQAWADYLDDLREGRADHRRHAVLPVFKSVMARLAA